MNQDKVPKEKKRSNRLSLSGILGRMRGESVSDPPSPQGDYLEISAPVYSKFH
jgi:hypothetical protein